MATGHRSIVKDPAKAFISTWRTSTVYTGSTADNQIKLPLEVAGTYKFTVQWGDGTSNLITTWNQAETTHTYPAPGDYTVTITGFIKGWDWGGGGTVAPTTGDMRKLLTITQFGCLRLVTHLDPGTTPAPFWGAFYGCTNLILTGVQDMPNFKGIISTQGFLRGCTLITTVNNINKWDVSKIQIFRAMFQSSPLFNDNVGNWNMSNATNIWGIFFGIASATSPGYALFNNGGSDSIKNWDVSKVTIFLGAFFNQIYFDHEIGLWDVSSATTLNTMLGSGVLSMKFNNAGSDSIKNWNTSNVTNISATFQLATKFDQEIGTWDVSKVTSMVGTFYGYVSSTGEKGIFNNGGSDSIKNWNTDNVTTMDRIFYAQNLFNQPIGNWNTSKVTNLNNAFALTTGFNQLLSNWNVSLVTNFNNFMNGRTFNDYSAANYDALLIGWASRPVKPSISINFGTIKYTAAASAARAILTSAPNNWTIVDGGI